VLYIFNSGLRSLYVENALRTLFLPSGATNDYRYKFRGKRTHVAAGAHDQLKKAAAEEPVAISFIDRYSAGGYIYHPLRLGTFVKIWEEDDYIYIRAQLNKFVAPHDATAFSARMYKELAPKGVAQLRGGDPTDVDDGNYVVLHDSLFESTTDFHWGTPAWSATVERLDQTQALASTDVEGVLFARAELVGPAADETLSAKLEAQSVAVFPIVQGGMYKFRVAYRFPLQKSQTKAAVEMKLEATDNVRVLGNVTRAVNGYADRFENLLVSNRYPDDAMGSLSVRFAALTLPQKLLAPNGADILVKIRPPASYWVRLALIVLVFGIAAAVVGIPPDHLPPGELKGVPIWAWLKSTFAVLQAAMLVLIFQLIGKKAL